MRSFVFVVAAAAALFAAEARGNRVAAMPVATPSTLGVTSPEFGGVQHVYWRRHWGYWGWHRAYWRRPVYWGWPRHYWVRPWGPGYWAGGGRYYGYRFWGGGPYWGGPCCWGWGWRRRWWW